MPKQQIYENLHFDSVKDKLILTIKQEKSFVFENALDKACEKWLQDNKSQKELDKLIKKQDGKYYIFKPLIVKYENIDTNTESKESQNDTESKRKIIYTKDEISFKNCVFCGEVRFEYISFGALDSIVDKETESNNFLRIDFQRCEFKERVYFTNCEFNGNVFFNHAVFERYADFHESIFNGIVSFYNVTFKSAPNFSTCVFGKIQGTDFINAKIDKLKFSTIKDFIDEYENDDIYKREATNAKNTDNIANKHKIRYANNARDSFRTIKNVLIENNNLIDASKWHKLELYAKEQEIKLEKPCLFKNAKKWCDLWQLKLYRKTSAHHTDLSKIWHTLMVLNGVFGLLFGLILLFNHCQVDIVKCAKLLCNDFCICNYVFCNAGKICINALLVFMFVVLFLCGVLCKFARYAFIGIGYLASFVILITNPKYLFPAVSLFEGKGLLSPIATISALYTMLFILVIFSLQKTARKNSIIPN